MGDNSEAGADSGSGAGLGVECLMASLPRQIESMVERRKWNGKRR